MQTKDGEGTTRPAKTAKPKPREASAGTKRSRAARITRKSAGASDAASSPVDQPLRVLFVHPSYPNQFTSIAEELHKQPGFECYALVHNEMMAQVAASGTAIQHFGFLPDGQPSAYSYPYINALEAGSRNAIGIANSLMALKQAVRFDAVVAHAAFGSSFYLKGLLDSALISYAELPGYQSAASRLEFPHTLDTVFAGRACESLIYTSMLNSDLGLVPSEYARTLYPLELHSKIRVQMEGFDTEQAPSGGEGERAVLGLPVDARLIGFFGRTLEAVRGFDIFMNVAKRLHERDNSLRFLVIGEDQSIYGSEMRYVENQTFKDYVQTHVGLPDEAVIWRRTLPYADFRRHIACLDMAILPLFEGAANWNLFEAMAVGLPILSSNRCFVPEVIRDGKEGILLDPYDVPAFVEQAANLLNNRKQASALGKAAKARIKKNYSMANAVAGYSAIIREAIALSVGSGQ